MCFFLCAASLSWWSALLELFFFRTFMLPIGMLYRLFSYRVTRPIIYIVVKTHREAGGDWLNFLFFFFIFFWLAPRPLRFAMLTLHVG